MLEVVRPEVPAVDEPPLVVSAPYWCVVPLLYSDRKTQTARCERCNRCAGPRTVIAQARGSQQCGPHAQLATTWNGHTLARPRVSEYMRVSINVQLRVGAVRVWQEVGGTVHGATVCQTGVAVTYPGSPVVHRPHAVPHVNTVLLVPSNHTHDASGRSAPSHMVVDRDAVTSPHHDNTGPINRSTPSSAIASAATAGAHAIADTTNEL